MRSAWPDGNTTERMAASQPRPRAIPKFRGKAIHLRSPASDADHAVNFAAGTDRLPPNAAKTRRLDRQTIRWRPQQRRRVESLWKKARLYSAEKNERCCREAVE